MAYPTTGPTGMSLAAEPRENQGTVSCSLTREPDRIESAIMKRFERPSAPQPESSLTPGVTRVVWLTDLHLNFLSRAGSDAFLHRLSGVDADAFLLGGDTGEAGSLLDYLRRLDTLADRPVFFVLGNHDFYGGSISSVNAAVTLFVSAAENLTWLNTAGVVRLAEQTALIGHGSWGDARLGNVRSSPVELNDFRHISELQGLSIKQRAKILNALGDEAATCLGQSLLQALESFQRVILLAHVPPFREAAVHEGQPSGDDWLPYFCCHAVGEMLRSTMSRRPDRHLTVLCGHTHGAGRCFVLPNLEVRTGGAEYGRPEIQGVLDCR